MRNLITNGIKYTPKGGKITIGAHTISNDNNQPCVEISVKDTGIGVPPEAQPKLFNIAESVTTRGTENETGTGLGLILCKESVEMHGGKIWVESDPDNNREGKGSTFCFTLPA
jgi:signal transduction histidine kinase